VLNEVGHSRHRLVIELHTRVLLSMYRIKANILRSFYSIPLGLKFLTRVSGEGPAYSPTRSPLKGNHKLANELGAKLSKFREELHRSREEISKVYPQFEEMESSVRSSMAIDRFGRNPQNTLNRTEESSGSVASPSERSPLSRYVESGLVKEWNELIFEAKEKLNASFKNSSKDECNSSRPSLISGILETDLDSGDDDLI